VVQSGNVVVVGMGEVGRPLFNIISKATECVGVDVEPVEPNRPCSVMHICYPFQVPDFIGTTLKYVQRYAPDLTVINSTVLPGTTRVIDEQSQGTLVAYSPVRGKHARMEFDMLRYRKFVAGCSLEASQKAADHFASVGFEVDAFRSPEIAELSKLLETSYLGILIAWAQEVERFAAYFGASFEEVNSFIEEVDFLPSHIYPGIIGGHCILPNLAILQTQFKSIFLDAIVASNAAKQDRQEPAIAERRSPYHDQGRPNRVGKLGTKSRTSVASDHPL
jgi:UDP-N-acetyl-D-mannosaminuronate dehydrogenase